MEQMTYEQAKAELLEISEAIENQNIPVDELAVKIKRASELLKLCKAKLKKTDEDVKKLIDDLNE